MSSAHAFAATTVALAFFAFTTSARAESECLPYVVEAVEPPTAGAAVPVGSTLRVFFDDGGCYDELHSELTCGDVTYPVLRDTQHPVDSHRAGYFEYTLPEEIADGASCTLRIFDDPRSGRPPFLEHPFAVGGEAPAPLGAPAIIDGRLQEVEADDEGYFSPVSNVTVEVAPDPLGMSLIAVFDQQGELCQAAAAPAAGGRLELDMHCGVAPEAEPCLRVEQVDALGRITSAEGCVESYVKSSAGDDAADDDGGCSLTTGPSRSLGAPLAIGLVALGALAARRRVVRAR